LNPAIEADVNMYCIIDISNYIKQYIGKAELCVWTIIGSYNCDYWVWNLVDIITVAITTLAPDLVDWYYCWLIGDSVIIGMTLIVTVAFK